MSTPVPHLLAEFIAEKRLPASFAEQAEQWFLPLAEALRELAAQSPRPPRIGVSGAQGSGKTTLAELLPLLLAQWGVSVARLSLDDFYLSRARRRALAASVHPLLATRGVPGTHELDLLVAVLDELTEGASVDSVMLPVFEKSIDDRIEAKAWREGRPDLVLLEGWFVGLSPQEPQALVEPVNSLEAEEDADGAWRRFVNARLEAYFRRVFASLDRLVFLRAPDFDSVYRWRGLQERKLRESAAAPDSAQASAQASAVMSEAELRRFIGHYERLTRHALATLPERADWMFVLDESQQIVARVDRLGQDAIQA